MFQVIIPTGRSCLATPEETHYKSFMHWEIVFSQTVPLPAIKLDMGPMNHQTSDLGKVV